MYHPIQLIPDVSLVAYYWVKLEKGVSLLSYARELSLELPAWSWERAHTVSRSSTFLRPALCLEKVEGTPVNRVTSCVPNLCVVQYYLSVSSREYISSGGKGMSCFLRSHKPNSLQQCLNAVCECLHFYEFVDLIFLVLSFDFHFSSIFLFW